MSFHLFNTVLHNCFQVFTMIHCSHSHCSGTPALSASRLRCWHSSTVPPSSQIKHTVGEYVVVTQAYRLLGLEK